MWVASAFSEGHSLCLEAGEAGGAAPEQSQSWGTKLLSRGQSWGTKLLGARTL